MKNLQFASAVTLLLICLTTPAVGAELPKKGECTYKAVHSAVVKTLPMEKERLEMQFEITGLVVEATEDSPLHNATMHALGELHAFKGDYSERGFARFTRPDGDLVFMTYEAQGRLGGARKVVGKLVGGTGKCAGMTGEMELAGVGGLKPPKEGAMVSMSIGRYNWTLP